MMRSERKATVFVVDDDESVGKSLTRMLTFAGYHAEAYSSARRFLESVNNDATGCVVSDIYMPQIDGFSFHQILRQLGYQLPVVFMSAHAKNEDREYALEQGAAGFLLKPFEQQSLLDLIEKIQRTGDSDDASRSE